MGEAAALYRGSLLEGFTLADAPLFDEWVRLEEAALSRAYLQVLGRLAAWAESRQAWLDAIGHAQRIVQLDPLSEEAQQRLIGLYVRQHAVGSAVRQYQRFETELQQELGVSPSADTRALIDEALRHRRDALPDTGTPLHPLAPAPPALPFVGRDQLLARLQALSRDPLAGRGVTLLLQGEAGIGKTESVVNDARRALLGDRDQAWLSAQSAIKSVPTR